MAAPLATAARQHKAANVPRIGYLFLQPWSATAHLRDAVRQGLREMGYAEDQNIPIDFRNAEGRPERLPNLAAVSSDPVGRGFVASLARPGRNITGMSTVASELTGKRLELLPTISLTGTQLTVLAKASTDVPTGFRSSPPGVIHRATIRDRFTA
jgi:putative ABC transport system substrate-binding protein